MKKHHHYYTLFISLFLSYFANAQSAVAVGAGSYASFPPEEELSFEWEGVTYFNDFDFVYNDIIYVSDNETRPIPTNDWWTNILIEQYGGLLYAYPLVTEPTAQGINIQYPNSFNANGTSLDRGNGLVVSGENYYPEKAIATDWSDWSVEMGMPDSSNNTNMNVTMTHGIPFTHIETENFNPIISANNGATYLNADGSAVTFPVTAGGQFIISSENRLFGIHLGDNASATLTNQQFIMVDLEEEHNLNSIELQWETAFASGYSIQTSTDNTNWTTIHTITDGNGGIDTHLLNNTARYVRILLQEKGTVYEYSLYEIQIFENNTNIALNKTVTATSEQTGFYTHLATDGHESTRWASSAENQEELVIDMANNNGHFVVSALTKLSDLTLFNIYAHNKPIDTKINYTYNVNAGAVSNTWNITTENLNGNSSGATIQGFIPHQYKNTTNTNVTFTDLNYVTARGQLKSSIGNSFTFDYKFGGILPNFNKPYENENDTNPYNSEQLYSMVSQFSAQRTTYGGDTYWGGKDLVNIAKYALIAKELNHQSFDKIKALSKTALVDWLTYTPGETENYYARYDRWKALVGFNQSFGSAQFTDHHFHYGYLIYAASLYAMLDEDFLDDYGDMLKLVCKQYANWEREDTFLPYFRTFDPWIGHSYAGGTSSGGGNNQESTSEAMQSWIGMFLLGEMLGDNNMRDAGAFGYTSESAATLEYWFDWDEENLPEAYEHNMVGILWNGGYSYGTFFSASPVHIHGIQYLPINPGFKYLAKDKIWAEREYNDMLQEASIADGHTSETDYGDDWAHVALGFKLLHNPEYVSELMDNNLAINDTASDDYIMDYEVAGLTYFYTHAMQNLGDFSFNYYTDIPTSSVFVNDQGNFSYAVAYNATNTDKTCNIYSNNGTIIDSFTVAAKTTVTYPELPDIGQEPENCYALASTVTASSGNDTANLAVDSNFGTRWISNTTEPTTLELDLGVKCNIEQLEVFWETASAKDYLVEISEDQVNWETISSFTDMAWGERTDTVSNIDNSKDYQYIRLNITSPSTIWPYSIFEINICGQVSINQNNDNDTLSISQVDNNTSESISISPNPVVSNFTIKGVNTNNTTISIYAVTGALVYSTNSNKKVINIDHLPSGMYKNSYNK